jgi:TatD DNase family protein
MILIDTHAHLNFAAFKKDFDFTVKRCLENDIWIINVGTKYETSKRAVELAQKYEKGVFAAVGLHPIHLETGLVKISNDAEEIEIKTTEQDFNYEKYRELGQNPKTVAIGEIGLDYYWKPKSKSKFQLFKEKQKTVFIQQLELAKELNLPVILHCRMAHNDLIEIISNFQKTIFKCQGVVHCFTGNLEQAKKFLAMGFYLGFNGIIFKKIEGIDFKEVIRNTPIDRILLETDCPYLTPPPMEGRNEPLFLKYIAKEIAKIKNLSYERLVETTTENARNLFKI